MVVDSDRLASTEFPSFDGRMGVTVWPREWVSYSSRRGRPLDGGSMELDEDGLEVTPKTGTVPAL